MAWRCRVPVMGLRGGTGVGRTGGRLVGRLPAVWWARARVLGRAGLRALRRHLETRAVSQSCSRVAQMDVSAQGT